MKIIKKSSKKVKKNNESNNVKFIPLRVSGFDKLITKKGIEEGNNIMISGGTGSGKTTFCLQSAINSLRVGEKVLYISFEESPKKMLRHMKNNYGWDFEQYIKKGLFKILRVDAFALSRAVEAEFASSRGEKLLIKVKGFLDIIPKGFKPNKIIIDSISALSAAFEDNVESYRVYLMKLIKDLEELNSINLIISETEQNPLGYSRKGIEEFLVDGVIVLYNIRQGNDRIRAIEVLKLRCSNHSKQLVPYKLTNKGMEIYNDEVVFLDEE